MCGIFFSCSEKTDLSPSNVMLNCLKRRGPDDEHVVQRQLKTFNDVNSPLNKVLYLTFVSTVLSFRGDQVVHQPLEDPSSGSLLCWNGEAWKINGTIVVGNDAQLIFSLLLNATEGENVEPSNRSIAYSQALQATINVISSISGPYSFVFYDARRQRIFYGRDVLGRRSLLSATAEDGVIKLSSICDGSVSDPWTEVEANGIYMLDLTTGPTPIENGNRVLKHISWSNKEDSPEFYPFLVRFYPRLSLIITLTNT